MYELPRITKEQLTQATLNYWAGLITWERYQQWWKIWDITENTILAKQRGKEIDLLVRRVV